MDIYKILKELNIKYQEVEHKKVMTSSDAAFIKQLIKGVGVKNLFLKSEDNYFLVLISDDKRCDLKELTITLNVKRLHFASSEELENILKLKPGSVTPLGIINDQANLVTVIIDNDLKDQVLLVHPLINTKTISIEYNDLIKYIKYFKHKYNMEKL